MTLCDPAKPDERALASGVLSAVRYYVGTRTGIVAAAAVVIGAGAWFNWGWLVAVGIAPLVVNVLPCAAMCALGLCMSGKNKSAGNVSPTVRNGLLKEPAGGTAPSHPGTGANAKEKDDCCGS